VTTLFVAVKDRKVVFLDIDEFKEFNTAHTEPVVGRNLLPRFTLALEAHAHHHGDAYRQGGDEYRVLLPGESRPLAVAFLAELRAKVAALKYPEGLRGHHGIHRSLHPRPRLPPDRTRAARPGW
jgi:PleD family two-component response regulator